jgi:hypothetical protein
MTRIALWLNQPPPPQTCNACGCHEHMNTVLSDTICGCRESKRDQSVADIPYLLVYSRCRTQPVIWGLFAGSWQSQDAALHTIKYLFSFVILVCKMKS